MGAKTLQSRPQGTCKGKCIERGKESETNPRQEGRKLFSDLEQKKFPSECTQDNKFGLEYNISVEKINRGFLVHIGCERFIFHEQEIRFMGTFLANYVKDYRGVRDTLYNNRDLCFGNLAHIEECVLGDVEKTCFQRFTSLTVELGATGYCIKASSWDHYVVWYLSNTTELADLLYDLITEKLGKKDLFGRGASEPIVESTPPENKETTEEENWGTKCDDCGG